MTVTLMLCSDARPLLSMARALIVCRPLLALRIFQFAV